MKPVGGYIVLVLVEGRFDAEVYEAHARELVRFATGLVGPADAEDVLSEAVLRVMSSPVWREAQNRRALLYRAVLFEARTWRRSVWRRRNRDARSAEPSMFELPELMPEVARAVAALSPQQRAVVFLTYWDDLDAITVADLLGVSVGTVRKQLGRARGRLRKVLG
jgi:RNA polymerase sigma-70 factor (ECF subfamily)